jgi:hypothetical protein
LPGDLVFYSAQVGAGNGHVSMVSNPGTISDFTAYDSNWGGGAFTKNGFPFLHKVRHNDQFNKFIVGYFRPPGGRGAESVQNMPTIATPELVDSLAQGFFGVNNNSTIASNPGLQYYVGQPLENVVNAFNSSQQRDNYLKSLQAKDDAITGLRTNLSDLETKQQKYTIDLTTIPADNVSMFVKVVAWLQGLVGKSS